MKNCVFSGKRNLSQRCVCIAMSSVYASTQLKKNREAGTYGHIRLSSFGMTLLFCCRHLWSSPVGLGFSTRLAQAADSLSGERILTPLPRLVRFVTLHASLSSVKALELCWRDCCRCQNPSLSCTSSFSRHSSLLSRGPLGCCGCPPSSQSAFFHVVLYPEVLDHNMPRLPKALAMRYVNGR